jgi:hypothetical protein
MTNASRSQLDADGHMLRPYVSSIEVCAAIKFDTQAGLSVL